MNPTIIIPDVHGRDFWRWAVAHRKEEDSVIFLGDISKLRWGSDPAGSMVWADVEEFEWREARLPNVIQVFGHTLQDNGPRVIDHSIYCLDCRRIFCLDASGEMNNIVYTLQHHQ